MKLFFSLITLFMISILFSACSSKNETSIKINDDNQIQTLLDEIYQKDKKIAELKKELMTYKKRVN